MRQTHVGKLTHELHARGGRKHGQYYKQAIKRHYGGELRGLAHAQSPGDESQRHPGRALTYEANGFAASALVLARFAVFAMDAVSQTAKGFNTREAPDESHDAACEGKSEHR